MINPIDAAGSLTYGKGDAKHSNGRLFRIPTGFPNSINKAIFSWFASCDRPGNPCRRGNPHADGHSKKAAATLYWAAAAVFPQQKITGSVLADPCGFTSFEQFSWLTHHKLPHSLLRTDPMTDFRLVWVPPRIQWRYRPGFSPGFLFSCGAVTASAGTQTEYLLSKKVYRIEL